MVQTVTGEYTDDHWDFVEPTDTDMLLVADPINLKKGSLGERAHGANHC